MSNAEQLKRLGDSVKGWNKWRAKEPGAAVDLERCDLSRLALSKVDLRGANLKGADLSGAELREANLLEAQLEDAVLWGADLSYASLRMAKLRCANLKDAMLDHADLTGADLGGARLETALVGVELTDTKPWTARLYPPTGDEGWRRAVRNRMERRMKKRRYVGRVGCLLRIVGCLAAEYGIDGPDRGDAEYGMYFRGEATPYVGGMKASVMRESGHRNNEAAMLRDLVSRRPVQFERGRSAFDRWVTARHHGLPTRLLDVTSNPLVALYNAAREEKCGKVHVFVVPRKMVKQHDSDVLSIVANFARLERREQDFLLGRKKKKGDGPDLRYGDAMQRWYHFIREEKSAFKARIDGRDLYRLFVAEPAHSIERVRAQAGAFLVSAFHEKMRAAEIKDSVERGDCGSCRSSKRWVSADLGIPIYDHYELTVPWCRKSRIRAELSRIGVTGGALFPELDAAADEIKTRY